MVFALIYFACTAAVCLYAAFPGPQRLRHRGEQFARTNLAFVDSEFVGAFDRATIRSARFTAIAAALLLTALWIFMQVEPEPHDLSPQVIILPVVAVLLACWGGWRLHQAGREFPVPAGRSAVARPRRVEANDYLARPARYGALLAAVVSCSLAARAVVQWRSGDASAGLAVTAAASSLALLAVSLLVQLSVRAMCDRPQPAVDSCHLYFYDAWRGEFVRGAYLVLWWSQFQFVIGVTPWLDWPQAVDDHVLEIVMVYAAAQMGILIFSSHLRFRKRLWSTLAPGQVLLPGQPVPPKREVFA